MPAPDPTTTMPRAGVLIIDDHALFAHGLALLVREQLALPASLEGRVEDAEARLRRGERFRLALLDLELPGVSGLAGVSRLLALDPALPVVICSSHAVSAVHQAALARGAAACIGKSEAPDRLLTVLRRVLRAGGAADVQEMTTVPESLDRPDTAEAPLALTPRQREVLWLMGDGKSNKLIARQLAMSENTVRNHVAAILDRLGVNNRLEAATAARRLGLLAPLGSETAPRP